MKLVDPCGRCGWKFPGFHICVDLSVPNPTPKKQQFTPVSDRNREAISQTQKERWARRREGNRARDQKIVERYKEGGIGSIHLSEEFGISKGTVLKILKEAQNAGLVVMRKPGHTLAKGAQ